MEWEKYNASGIVPNVVFVAFVMDIVGGDIVLTHNPSNYIVVFLATFLSTFEDVFRLLISYYQDFHVFASKVSR